MSCIRTGANVHITNYGRLLHCDLFRVGDTIIAKAYPNQLYTAPMIEEGRGPVTHVMDLPGADNEAWDDRGVFIAPAYAVGVVGPDGKSHHLHMYRNGDGGYYRDEGGNIVR